MFSAATLGFPGMSAKAVRVMGKYGLTALQSRAMHQAIDIAENALKTVSGGRLSFGPVRVYLHHPVGRFYDNPVAGKSLTNKVSDQMAHHVDEFRAFPENVDRFAGWGEKYLEAGKDGVMRTHVKLKGTYAHTKDGTYKEGYFKWIINSDNTINHRKFYEN